MKRLLLLSALLAATALAQQPAAPASSRVLPPEQQASRADIQRLFQALRLEQQLNNMQEQVVLNIEKMMEQTVSADVLSKLTPQQRTKYDAYMARNRRRAREIYPVREMLDDFIPVYQRYFSKSDVDAVVAFYSSPIGTRLLDSQPDMMREGMAILTPKLQQRMQKTMEEIRRDADQIFKDDAAPQLQPKS